MNKELYVSSTPHETRLALAEDGEIAEVTIEREKEYSLAGAIYKGRVTRVLPGMQSAFVDIGLERDAFLYVSDFFEDSEEYDRVVSEAESAVERLERPATPVAERERPTAPAAERDLAAAPAAPPAVTEARGEAREGREGEERRRRGRHRGRRGRSGIPEEKFARPEDFAGAREREEGGERQDEAEAAGPEAGPGGEAAALVLPGESLAKYRGGPRVERSAPVERMPRAERMAEAERVAPAAEPSRTRAEAPVVAAAQAALVLPGESLAKYRQARVEAPAVAPAAVKPVVEAEPEEELETERQSFEHERSQPDSPREVEAQAGLAAMEELLEEEEEAEAGEEEREPGEGVETAGEDASATVRAEGGEARLQAPGRGREERGEGRGEGRGRGRRRRRGRGGERPAAEGEGGGRGREGREARPEARPEPRSEGKNESARLIGDLLREGQEILIQIAKEPLGKKGARITSHLALPGRFLVYMPTVHHIGVSRKISSDEERARLKRLILENSQNLPGGFIVRTAGAGASDEEFKADIRLLASQWNDMRQQFEQVRAPALLHHDLNLVERTLRDQLSNEFTHIWVDTDEQYQRVVKFVSYFMPHLVDRVRLYTRDEPLFEHFGIQEEINKALKSKVWLKSGGYIVLNQTEALVAIDVNTGKYVGRSNRLEDTIVKTNVEAIQEIVRQIRLRDLGGIIVIDFIDMDERRNRQRVMQALEEAMQADRAPSKILAFNDFGLVALTRKRVKQSLERTLGSACPYCSGVGLVKSPTTVCNEIFAEVRKVAPTMEREDLVLRVNPEVAKALKAQGALRLRELEEMTRKAISVRPDPQVHQEQFEIY